MAEATPTGKKLAGKVAIITGGASGIGEATARAFVKEGTRIVVLADVQDQLGLSVVSSIGEDSCIYSHCDVTDETQVKTLIDLTIRNYGRLDIMFSNAGIMNPRQHILDLDLSSMERLFAVNVRGMAACVKHAARAMVEGGIRGSIVCTASIAASKGSDMGIDDYHMSKHAVLGLIRTASCELGKHGIRVNCVSPAAVATPLMMRHFGIEDKKVAEETFANQSSLTGMVLKASHVADAVVFLASDQSAYVTGHDLHVDGGINCQMNI